MEILNNIWAAFISPNQMLINILSIPLSLIEVTVTMLLFSVVLNIKSNRKQKLMYIAISTVLSVFCTFCIPKPYSNIITLLAVPVIMMFVFKVSFLKGICAEFIPVIVITILEMIFARVCLIMFGIDYQINATVPLLRIAITGSIYFSLFLLYKFLKHINFNINILDKINKQNKITLMSNILITILVLFMQIYLIVYYNDKLPLGIIFMDVFSLISYFCISIYSMVETMNLEKTQLDLEQEKLSYKTLQTLHDDTRAFKHDFSNILAGIGGYIETNDMAGLKKYYSQILQERNQVNNFSTLSTDVVNSPPIYAVLANKYYAADNLGIKVTLESFIDFNKLYMDIYEFTRILGILTDNAIEAATESKSKRINVTIRNDSRRNRQLLIIENTYNDKNIDIDKISEKGYSTKTNNTGLGLWEVDKIIKKHENIAKFTTKNDEFFIQQIEIYNE